MSDYAFLSKELHSIFLSRNSIWHELRKLSRLGSVDPRLRYANLRMLCSLAIQPRGF
jgi:hypothetical protein